MTDTQYEEHKITKVESATDGWFISFDGSGIFCPTYAGEPRVGSVARLYGKGFGYPTRGMFIDGTQVYYRTPEEDEEHREIELYGRDAADWLARWDDNRSVWSIEMGGLGPGYEQCIHITAAEILRHLLIAKYDTSFWEDGDLWKKDREAIEQYGFTNEAINGLGLSGAQWGAALNLAVMIYKRGPRAVMNDPRVKGRHIQVSKTFRKAA